MVIVWCIVDSDYVGLVLYCLVLWYVFGDVVVLCVGVLVGLLVIFYWWQLDLFDGCGVFSNCGECQCYVE